MKLAEVMKALERAGSEQTRKTYRRHGAPEPMFGVSYAALYALQKKIGTDQELAEALWQTGNHDARTLAMLVADGDRIAKAVLERWRKDSDNRFAVMAFAALAARSKPGLTCARKWIDGKGEFEQAVGWGTFAGLASRRAVGDDELALLLPRLERGMHQLPNFARYMANNCLIAIGGRPALEPEAMRVAKAVGRVEVDHGDTECKTPVASEYIAKMAARAHGKAGKASGKAAREPSRKAGSAPRAAKARPTARK